MGESQDLALLQVRSDLLPVDLALVLVRQEDLNVVRLLGRIGHGHDLHSVRLRPLPGSGARHIGSDDVKAGVLQVLSLGVPLISPSHYGDGLVLQHL